MDKSTFASYLKGYGCDYSVIAKLFDIIEQSQIVRDVLKKFIYEIEHKEKTEKDKG